jgi:hypothetical protein
MPTSNQLLISEKIRQAPNYHLAENLDQELPIIEENVTKSEYLDALAEISAIQIFKDIPGIKKTKISIGLDNFFEVWQLIPNRVLLKEDLQLLEQDKERVEAITAQLMQFCECYLSSEIFDNKLDVQSWQDVSKVVEHHKYDFEFLNIDYSFPETLPLSDHVLEATACYNISLIATRPFNGGYIEDDYNSLYNFSIEARLKSNV